MYDTLIDGAALAAANERHRQVQMRRETAAAALDAAERDRDAAAEAHDVALGDGGDTKATAKRLRDTDAALKVAQDTVPAVERAIERSANQLRGEIATAHKPMRDGAVRGLLRHAAEIDRLRHDLAAALSGYAAAAAAVGVARDNGCAAPSVSARAPHVADEIAHWTRLPADRDVAPYLAGMLRGTSPECAALVDAVAVEGAAQ
jgi:hypothetical protein